MSFPWSSPGARVGANPEFSRDVYTRRRAATLAASSTIIAGNRPYEFDITKENRPGLPRRMGRRVVMEEDASADAGGRLSTADADLYRIGRARASRQSLDRSGNPHPGYLERDPLRGSQRRRSARPFLWRH